MIGLPPLAVTVELPRVKTTLDRVTTASNTAVELPTIITSTDETLVVTARSELPRDSEGSALRSPLATYGVVVDCPLSLVDILAVERGSSELA